MRVNEIKNAEEKKYIIGFVKLQNHKLHGNQIHNTQIYAEWLERWRDDFVVDGKCLQMRRQKFLVSVKKYKAGEPLPEVYVEYNEFINSIRDWFNLRYNNKTGMKKNRRYFEVLLTEHRLRCMDELNKIMKDQNIEGQITYKNKKKQTDLALYEFVSEKRQFTATFDDMKEYLENWNK